MKDSTNIEKQFLDKHASQRRRPAEQGSTEELQQKHGGLTLESAQLAESIVETIREPLLVLDVNLRVIFANKAFYQAFKLTAGDSLGKLIYELGNWEWDIPALRQLLEKILPGNTSFEDLEVKQAFETIGPRTMLLSARRLYKKANKTEMILLAIQDVTERRANEEKIEHLNRVLAAIRQVNQLIVKEKNLDRLLQGICSSLIETRGYHNAWIALLDESSQLVATAEAGQSKTFQSLAKRLAQGHVVPCIRRAFSSSEVVITEDVVQECNHCPLADSYRGRGALTVRLNHQGHLYGFLCVSAPKELLQNVEERNLFQEVADDIAFALHTLELEKVRQRTEKSNALLAAAVEEAAESIVITDSTGTIEYVNPAFERITGYAREEVIGENPRILKSGKHGEQFYKEMWDVLTSGMDWHGHFINKKKDGSLYEEDATISPIKNASGEITHYVGVKRDVTHEVALEKQLRQAQKMEAIGTLAGGIAHDFNNILSAILGYTEMALLSAEEGSGLQADLHEVRNAGLRARDLVNQILLFSRQREEEKRPVKVTPLVKEVIKFLRATLPVTIEIRQQIEASLDTVFADPTQIHQVLMNLCTNASHAMGEERGVLEVRLTNVDLDATSTSKYPGVEPGPYLHLAVSDTGHGMPPEVLQRIFEPYFTTKEKGEGTGLGLAVVHGIVTSLGGVIEVSSEPGKGSSFDIYLPTMKGGEKPEADRIEPIPTGNERILFIDDEEVLARLGKEMLEHLGYEVTIRTSGLEALELFRARPGDFDLVIADTTMPQITGDQLATELGQIRSDIGIILCTGFSDVFTRRRARPANVRAVVRKPLLMREIARAIRSVLDQPLEDVT
ncbi:MAG: PAS domain S-box protein [Deltaproteobacteria bacterium]|nr:PAS domain S-box protein [Deltaproteobacteria bacterium]